MFGIGMPEMLLLLAIALIVIGPKKLPDLAKSLGKAMGEFRKATSEIKDSFEINEEINDVKKRLGDISGDFQSSLRINDTNETDKSVPETESEAETASTKPEMEKAKGSEKDG